MAADTIPPELAAMLDGLVIHDAATWARVDTDAHNARVEALRAAVAERLRTPRLCPGTGTVPPTYQGMTASTTAGWAPSACGVCGIVRPVGPDGLLTAHAAFDGAYQDVRLREAAAVEARLRVALQKWETLARITGARGDLTEMLRMTDAALALTPSAALAEQREREAKHAALVEAVELLRANHFRNVGVALNAVFRAADAAKESK